MFPFVGKPRQSVQEREAPLRGSLQQSELLSGLLCLLRGRLPPTPPRLLRGLSLLKGRVLILPVSRILMPLEELRRPIEGDGKTLLCWLNRGFCGAAWGRIPRTLPSGNSF
uniref:Uncharacterized protein n=1 Tax=Sphaerodactylus townsendi TaxID=933632 RepID=A0ACB8G6M0_9SAUR